MCSHPLRKPGVNVATLLTWSPKYKQLILEGDLSLSLCLRVVDVKSSNKICVEYYARGLWMWRSNLAINLCGILYHHVKLLYHNARSLLSPYNNSECCVVSWVGTKSAPSSPLDSGNSPRR